VTLPSLASALSAIPNGLRQPLVDEFQQALDEYRAADWEKVGLKAGKFCEIAYCVCAGHAQAKFPSVPTKPKNFPQACRDLEQHNQSRGRSLCMQVPKVLTALYELRNNRAIGHISSEISPNHMDAEFFLRSMKWVMGEFVRNFSVLPLEQSHALIESVTARNFQIVWSSGEIRRVLEPTKTAADKVLIILYAEGIVTPVDTLRTWVEYKNASEFVTKVANPLR